MYLQPVLGKKMVKMGFFYSLELNLPLKFLMLTLLRIQTFLKYVTDEHLRLSLQ